MFAQNKNDYRCFYNNADASEWGSSAFQDWRPSSEIRKIIEEYSSSSGQIFNGPLWKDRFHINSNDIDKKHLQKSLLLNHEISNLRLTENIVVFRSTIKIKL